MESTSPDQKIVMLLLKRLSSELTSLEEQELAAWAQQSEEHEAFVKRAGDRKEFIRSLAKLSQVAQFIDAQPQAVKRTAGRLYQMRRWLVAACLVSGIGLATYYFYTRQDSRPDPVQTAERKKTDLLPGRQKATLQLADSTVIVLDDLDKGAITQVKGVQIRKTADGQLEYDASAVPASTGNSGYHVVRTPIGGYYAVVLPDHTKAWLNAASSIRFPVVFQPDKRIVEMEGEVYFEVAKEYISTTSKRKPFIVQAGDETIEVLGTHFNISRYAEERQVAITLLEGSVQVKSGNNQKILHPGEQAVADLDNHSFDIKEVDAESTISWKDNLFFFDNVTLSTGLRQIVRWYGVEEVEFAPGSNVSKKLFGKIQRNLPLSEVLPQLESIAGVKIELVNKTLKVKAL